MAFDLEQFKNLITKVITAQELCSESAVNLLLGTAAVESDFGTYLRQLRGGPALGAFGFERDTELSQWENYLKFRYERRRIITKISGVFSPMNEGAMEWNLVYQVCMARLYYRRIVEPFPNPYDVVGMAKYWNEFWNRNPEKGTEADFIHKYLKYCGKMKEKI